MKVSGWKRLLIIGLAVCLGLAAAGCSVPAFSQGPVTVESREVTSRTDALTLSMEIPVVKGVKDGKLQARINDELEKAALRERQEITRMAKLAERLPGATYELNWEYKVSYNKNCILSLTTTAYQFTGGAHGMTVKKSYNYDLNAGKRISLAGVFLPGTDYITAINSEIKKQIASRPESFLTGDSGFQSIADNQEYYLEDGRLVVYFGLYEIAPYSTGIPEFKIPFSRFNGQVRADLLE